MLIFEWINLIAVFMNACRAAHNIVQLLRAAELSESVIDCSLVRTRWFNFAVQAHWSTNKKSSRENTIKNSKKYWRRQSSIKKTFVILKTHSVREREQSRELTKMEKCANRAHIRMVKANATVRRFFNLKSALEKVSISFCHAILSLSLGPFQFPRFSTRKQSEPEANR